MRNNDILRQSFSHAQATAFANESMMASVIDRIDVLSLNNEGDFADGDATDDTSPTLSGRAPAHSNLLILNNGTVIGLVQASAEGKWRFMPEQDLQEGEHSFQVQVADVAAPKSAAWHMSVLSGEQLVQLKASAAEYAQDTPDSVADDKIISYAPETAAPESNAVVPEASLLADATDNSEAQPATAEHIAPQTVDNVIHEDTAPLKTRSVVINGFSDDESSNDSVMDPSEIPISEDPRPLLRGEAEPGAQVDLFDNEVAMGTTFADTSGHWEFVPFDDLAMGDHTIVAEVAGVKSEPFIIEITLPQPSLTLQIDDLIADDGQILVPQIVSLVDDAPLTLTISAEDMAYETPYGIMLEQTSQENTLLMSAQGHEEHLNAFM